MSTDKKNTEKELLTDPQKASGSERPTKDNTFESQLSVDLGTLEGLLQKQIKLIREDKISKLEALSIQSASVVEKLHRSGMLESTDFQKSRDRLVKLYRQLILMVEAGKQKVGQQLHKIGEGRKTLKAYRNA